MGGHPHGPFRGVRVEGVPGGVEAVLVQVGEEFPELPQPGVLVAADADGGHVTGRPDPPDQIAEHRFGADLDDMGGRPVAEGGDSVLEPYGRRDVLRPVGGVQFFAGRQQPAAYCRVERQPGPAAGDA